MRKHLSSLLIPTILLIAGAAHASPPTIATSGESEPKERRVEIDVGMLVGGSDIGDMQRSTYGLHVNIGHRFGDLALLGEYNYLAIGKQTSNNRGSMSRAGVVARYSLLRTSGKPGKPHKRGPVSGDYWVEAGAGMQRLTWDKGGTLTRPDLVFGFGLQLNGVIGRKTDKPRYYGPYVAFRAHVARAPAHPMDVMPTCAGPCDTESTPSRNDVGLFFHFGANWGR